MSLWADRLTLADEGWSTNLRISKGGWTDPDTLGVGLWAKTWRWHDRVAEVSLHTHAARKRGAPLIGVLDHLSATLLEGCRRAWRDYPDCVPCQTGMRDGPIQMARSDWHTQHWATRPPVLFTPDILNILRDGRDEGIFAQAVERWAGMESVSYDDALVPYAEPRLVRDERPAEWHFEIRHSIRKIGDVCVKSAAWKDNLFRTRILDEVACAGLIRLSGETALHFRTAYGPEGPYRDRTPNGLPPGFEVFRPEPMEPDMGDPEL